jgi:hypothetical protein
VELEILAWLALSFQRPDVIELPFIFNGDNRESQRFEGFGKLISTCEARSRLVAEQGGILGDRIADHIDGAAEVQFATVALLLATLPTISRRGEVVSESQVLYLQWLVT